MSKEKKAQVKFYLSQDAIRRLKELQPGETLASSASRILEAVKDYEGDFISLLYLISHPEDRIVKKD